MQTPSHVNLHAGHFVPSPQLLQRHSKPIGDGHKRIAPARRVERHAR